MTQLDPQAATEARDEALERVEAAADEAWKQKAYDTVLSLKVQKAEFICDDIWATGLEKPREARALGPVMLRLARKGIIQKTGRSVKTAQVTQHATDVAVWRFT